MKSGGRVCCLATSPLIDSVSSEALVPELVTVVVWICPAPCPLWPVANENGNAEVSGWPNASCVDEAACVAP